MPVNNDKRRKKYGNRLIKGIGNPSILQDKIDETIERLMDEKYEFSLVSVSITSGPGIIQDPESGQISQVGGWAALIAYSYSAEVE